jgi:hypothetical protein
MGVANALAALDMGVRTLDSSIAGLGGCPYSPGCASLLPLPSPVLLPRLLTRADARPARPATSRPKTSCTRSAARRTAPRGAPRTGSTSSRPSAGGRAACSGARRRAASGRRSGRARSASGARRRRGRRSSDGRVRGVCGCYAPALASSMAGSSGARGRIANAIKGNQGAIRSAFTTGAVAASHALRLSSLLVGVTTHEGVAMLTMVDNAQALAMPCNTIGSPTP